MNTGYETLTQNNQQAVKDLRTETDKIRCRAQRLPDPERTLVTMYLDNANSYRQIARLTGLNESTVSRRIRKIIRKLRNDRLNAALVAGDTLTQRQKKIARDYFLLSMTLKQIADAHHTSYYNVRKTVRSIHKTLQAKYKSKTRNY